jgi:DNA-binding PadR family transcriptional regulator
MGSLYVPYRVLFMIEAQHRHGIDDIKDDDVQDFLNNRISPQRAKNILGELYRRGFLSRVKVKRKKGRRGPRRYLYKITQKGIKRCEYLRTLGYSLG